MHDGFLCGWKLVDSAIYWTSPRDEVRASISFPSEFESPSSDLVMRVKIASVK